MLQQWLAVGNSVFDLTDPRFEPQTSHSRDERVTARRTSRQTKPNKSNGNDATNRIFLRVYVYARTICIAMEPITILVTVLDDCVVSRMLN